MCHRHLFCMEPARLCLALCLGASLVLPSRAPAKDKAGTGLQNALILVVRHGEKPDSGAELSKAGKKRAEAYVGYFQNYTVNAQPLHLTYLFSAADSKQSNRARLTLEPLSRALGLPINSQYPETKSKELVAALRKLPSGNQILICWHHGEIPDLLTVLGADAKSVLGVDKWPDTVFDWVIQLRYDSKGRLQDALRVNEKLMPGDTGKQ